MAHVSMTVFTPSTLINYNSEYFEDPRRRDRLDRIKAVLTRRYHEIGAAEYGVLPVEALWPYDDRAKVVDAGFAENERDDLFVASVEWLGERGFRSVQFLCPREFRTYGSTGEVVTGFEASGRMAYSYLTMTGPWVDGCRFKWGIFFEDDDDLLAWMLKRS